MFPMEFDHAILATLPLPDEGRIRSVVQVLRALVNHRVLPYFRTKKGTDPLKLGHVSDQLAIARLEDEDNRVRMISTLVRVECMDDQDPRAGLRLPVLCAPNRSRCKVGERFPGRAEDNGLRRVPPAA